jgi:hypothetical protein
MALPFDEESESFLWGYFFRTILFSVQSPLGKEFSLTVKISNVSVYCAVQVIYIDSNLTN